MANKFNPPQTGAGNPVRASRDNLLSVMKEIRELGYASRFERAPETLLTVIRLAEGAIAVEENSPDV